MAMPDPIVLPSYDGDTNVPLDRISTSLNTSVYANVDKGLKLTISHTYGKRTRRVVRLEHTKIVADPLVSTVSRPVSASVTFTVNLPEFGYSADDALILFTLLGGQMGVGTPTMGAKLIGGQN